MSSISDYASLLQAQGKLEEEEAAPLYREALAGRRAAAGSDTRPESSTIASAYCRGPCSLQ